MHFIVANLNSSDTVKLFFSRRTALSDRNLSGHIANLDEDRRIWRLLPGAANCCEGIWESPPWRCGQFGLDILIQVVTKDGKKFDFLTSEVTAFGSFEASIFQLIEVSARRVIP
jgi:hypothetical protein